MSEPKMLPMSLGNRTAHALVPWLSGSAVAAAGMTHHLRQLISVWQMAGFQRVCLYGGGHLGSRWHSHRHKQALSAVIV